MSCLPNPSDLQDGTHDKLIFELAQKLFIQNVQLNELIEDSSKATHKQNVQFVAFASLEAARLFVKAWAVDTFEGDGS